LYIQGEDKRKVERSKPDSAYPVASLPTMQGVFSLDVRLLKLRQARVNDKLMIGRGGPAFLRIILISLMKNFHFNL